MEPVDISYWSESSIIAESDNLKRVIHSKYNQVETIFDAKRIIAETTKDVSVMNSIASIDFLKNNLLRNLDITVDVLFKLNNIYPLRYYDIKFLIKHSKNESVLEYILRLFETYVSIIPIILTSKNIPKALVSKVISEFKNKDEIIETLLSNYEIEPELFNCILKTRRIISGTHQEFLCKNATNPSTLESLFEYCKKYDELKEKTNLIKMIASNPNINEKTVNMIMDYDSKRFSEAINNNEKAKAFVKKQDVITIENSYVTEHGVYHENDSQAYTVDSVPEEYQISFIEKISKRSGGIGYHEIPFIINAKFTDKVQKMILVLKNNKLNELLSLNKNTSYDTLKELAYDNSEITRGNVFNHIKRDDSIRRILKDMDCVIGCDGLKKLCNFAETTNDKRIHEKIYLFNKDKIDVLCSLAKNEFIDENIQNLLAHGNLEVRKVLAANNSIVEREQIYLISSASSNDILEILASNEAVKESAQNLLIQQHPNVVKKLIKNPSVTINLLEKIASENNKEFLLEISSLGIDLSKEIIDRLAKSSYDEVRIFFSKRKGHSTETLKLLANDKNPQVRANAAKSIYVKSSELEFILVYDKDVNVRIELAKNKSISSGVRYKLLQNDEEEVRLAVIKYNKLNNDDYSLIIESRDKNMLKAALESAYITDDEKNHINEKIKNIESSEKYNAVPSVFYDALKHEFPIIKTNEQVTLTEPLSSEEFAKVQEKFDRIQKLMDEVNKTQAKPIETEVKPIETEAKPISSPTNNFKSNLMSEIDSSSIRVASRQITKLTLVSVPKKYKTSFFPKILANVLIHGVLENVHSNNPKAESIKSKISQEMKIEAMSMIGNQLANIVKDGIIKVLNNTKTTKHTETPSLNDGQKLNTVTNTVIDTNSIVEDILSKSNK
jgi:ribosome assembly protein YihI (activator of Der GTPase)